MMSRSTVQSVAANLVLALVSSTMMHPVSARDATGRLSRADVRTDTLAAAKAHALIPAGEAELPTPHFTFRSLTTRRQVNADTLKAAKEGSLIPAGEAAEWQASRLDLASSSGRTRSQVVAETRAAAKAHELIPAGEGWYPARYRQ